MMHYKQSVVLLCIGFLFSNIFADSKKPAKIVGLVQVRDEEIFITNCLKGLAPYTDAIIILDDASSDNTVSIIEKLVQECNIEIIIRNSEWKDWDEKSNKTKLLDAARAIGGTHMIIMDADEMFTASCLKDDYLRKKILALKPGDSMGCQLINLWRGLDVYRDDDSVWLPHDLPRFFCDNGTAYYRKGYLHDGALPKGLDGTYYISDDVNYGLLHFQFVNWENLLIKQAWYRCLEYLHNPKQSVQRINAIYGRSKDETNIRFSPTRKEWFAYPFFDASIFNKSQQSRKKQVQIWFAQYGKDFFKDLDIWDIDWK